MVSTLLNVLQRERGKKVKMVVINVGELQQIDREIFEFALKEQEKGTALEGFKPILKNVPASFKCIACRHEWGSSESTSRLNEKARESIHLTPQLARAFIKCPKCNSLDFEVVQGEGIWIDKVKITFSPEDIAKTENTC